MPDSREMRSVNAPVDCTVGCSVQRAVYLVHSGVDRSGSRMGKRSVERSERDSDGRSRTPAGEASCLRAQNTAEVTLPAEHASGRKCAEPQIPKSRRTRPSTLSQTRRCIRLGRSALWAARDAPRRRLGTLLLGLCLRFRKTSPTKGLAGQPRGCRTPRNPIPRACLHADLKPRLAYSNMRGVAKSEGAVPYRSLASSRRVRSEA